MGDKNLNELLKWSIENSTRADDTTESTNAPRSTLTPELMAALMGGPSDAELMVASMQAIQSDDPEISLSSKVTAFDNLEQLIESLDNANLLSKLGLWTPLLECLAHPEAEIRKMAAWCTGTAVQNNEPCQERLVAHGGVERLVRMTIGHRLPPAAADSATKDGGEEYDAGSGEETSEVRRKAIYALSSAVRNYQPAMDACAAELRRRGHTDLVGEDHKSIDASNMDDVDAVISGLKAKVPSS
ncbi:nucleotide exchange factor Fes1-domain-containing protein [Xylariaceae sp. FL0594]|nr:nucleotide exchange factor Fes1-domain-containing protein [Xylariaceae sp. FL0594]